MKERSCCSPEHALTYWQLLYLDLDYCNVIGRVVLVQTAKLLR